MDFVPLLVLSALVKKIVDTAKYAAAGDVNAVVTQVVAWAAGILVAVLGAHSDFGSTVVVNGFALVNLNGWSQVIVGVNIASVAGIVWDAIKAVDNTNSAVVPNLLSRPATSGRLPDRSAPIQG